MTTLAPILIATLLPVAPATRTTPEAGVRQTLAALDRAWNAHDMHAFAGLFTPDADLVNPVGMWWKGRPTIERALTTLHRTMFKDVGLSTREVGVRLPEPHLAIAVTRDHETAYKTGIGRLMPATDQRSTYVLVEKGGRWLIASGQVTPIDAVAAKHDPARA